MKAMVNRINKKIILFSLHFYFCAVKCPEGTGWLAPTQMTAVFLLKFRPAIHFCLIG